MTRKIALAYSGSLESSALLKWVKEKLQAPVTALVADLGQPEDAGALSRKAAKIGADKTVLADLRDEFARDYVFAALKADLLLDGGALARPLLAKVLVKVAKSEGCDAVAAGPGLEPLLKALAPELEVFAPGRGEIKTRAELVAYAERHALPFDPREKTVAVDANLLRARYEGGPLDDPWAEPPAELFRLTADPLRAPDAPETVEIEFADGLPAAVDKASLAPAKLIQKLNELAGRHGVGRLDVVERSFAGLKARAVYEAPGAVVLRRARRAVESLAMDAELLRRRDALARDAGALLRDGLWFSPEMGALRAYLDEARKGVNGAARIRLFKGGASLAGRKSANSLYNPELAGAEAFSADAGGWLRASGWRLALNKSLRRGP